MRIDDGADDDVDVSLFVGVHAAFVQQFLDDVREFFGQGFPYFRTGVFGRYILAHFYQLVQGDDIPVFQLCLYRFYQLQFLLGVINQGAKFFLFRLAQGVAEYFVHFPFDRSRGIAQHVAEGFVFAVQVGKEMFGTFRQVQYGFQVDDFGAGGGYGREAMRKQFEVTDVVLNHFGRDLVVGFHGRYGLNNFIKTTSVPVGR